MFIFISIISIINILIIAILLALVIDNKIDEKKAFPSISILAMLQTVLTVIYLI